MAKTFMSFEEKQDEPEIERAPEVEVVSTGEREIDVDERLGKVIGGGEGAFQIAAPKYTTLKRGKMQVSYAVINDDDYYYQVELLKPSPYSDADILKALIQAFSGVVPKHIHTYIKQPPEDIDWPVYTAIVKGGAKLIGAKSFMEEKLVNKLLELPLWE